MNSVNNIQRSDLLTLVKEGESHHEKLTQLNQSDRKTFKLILETFIKNPNTQFMQLDKIKFDSLKANLLSKNPKIKKESSITNFFLKIVGKYVNTRTLETKLGQAVDHVKKTYSPSDYFATLHKLQDNLDGVTELKLLEKAEQTLSKEILPKLNSTAGMLIPLDKRQELEAVKQGFENLVNKLKTEKLNLILNIPIDSSTASNPAALLLLRMSSCEQKHAEIYQKFGSISPEVLLNTFKTLTTSDAILKGGLQVLQMKPAITDPKVQKQLEAQQRQILEFASQWLDIYGTELQDPKIQAAFNTLVTQGKNSQIDDIKNAAIPIEKKLKDNAVHYLTPKLAEPPVTPESIESTNRIYRAYKKELSAFFDRTVSLKPGSKDYLKAVNEFKEDLQHIFAEIRLNINPSELAFDPQKGEKSEINCPNLLKNIEAHNIILPILQEQVLRQGDPDQKGSIQKMRASVGFLMAVNQAFHQESDLEGIFLMNICIKTANLTNVHKYLEPNAGKTLKSSYATQAEMDKLSEPNSSFKDVRAHINEVGVEKVDYPTALFVADRTGIDQNRDSIKVTLPINQKDVEINDFPNIGKLQLLNENMKRLNLDGRKSLNKNRAATREHSGLGPMASALAQRQKAHLKNPNAKGTPPLKSYDNANLNLYKKFKASMEPQPTVS